MISILLDTNILVDIFVSSRPQHDEALALCKRIFKGDCRGYISACSLKDMYYLTCSHVDERLVRSFIEVLIDNMTILSVDKSICTKALTSNEPDFEDGIIRASAETALIDYIVTRDAKGFTKSPVRKASAGDILQLL